MLDKLRDKINDVDETVQTIREVMVTFTFTDKDLEDEEMRALYETLIASKTAVTQEIGLDIQV